MGRRVGDVSSPRVLCAGAVVTRPDGRCLLVRRANEPDRGCWTLPGGKLEPGESFEVACAREVLEETGLAVAVDAFVGEVELPLAGPGVALVRDFRCTPLLDADLDAVRAGDDASDVGWFTPEEMRALACTPGLLQALEAWKVLEPAPGQTFQRSTAGDSRS